MDASQQRFKVTSEFNPNYGGSYYVTVEDLSTGSCKTSWVYDKASVKTRAGELAKLLENESGIKSVEVSYLDKGKDPEPDPGEPEAG